MATDPDFFESLKTETNAIQHAIAAVGNKDLTNISAGIFDMLLAAADEVVTPAQAEQMFQLALTRLDEMMGGALSELRGDVSRTQVTAAREILAIARKRYRRDPG